MKICQNKRYWMKFDPYQDVGRRKITEKDRDSSVLVHTVDQYRFWTERDSAYLTELSKIAIFVEIFSKVTPVSPRRMKLKHEKCRNCSKGTISCSQNRLNMFYADLECLKWQFFLKISYFWQFPVKLLSYVTLWSRSREISTIILLKIFSNINI